MQKQTVASRILSLSAPDAALDPWPLPKEVVTSGDPEARGLFLWQSDDKRLGNGVWSCTPGSFNWDYTWDETIYFREGEVTISDQDGNSNTYRGGDMVFVPTGTKAKWEVTKTVEKAFHIRSDTPVEL
jgi:uncharacterized cupin superfamily protein